ncbi:MAG: hypothetical protein A3I61_19940 [Acidobacteria bacterium RIFCSPLOWO2_02_FULL_68_18]|nr:MAG: hypothetical protein A3I61_19940 [Acidobacteria bacterium RIFCSPLOWO2_02_FULL_68_18]OFW48265.1 MAG: hypothetical protein A3G77_03200 [Acidobacteria bacterium RIFCSPLOWO2_12_FULL_68_19]
MLTLKRAAERTFSLEDQFAFARLSGDWNPIHLDHVFARRTRAGDVIVHGVHAALWALDACLSDRDGRVRLRSFKASFIRPMPVQTRLRTAVSHEEQYRAAVQIFCGPSLALQLDIAWGADSGCPEAAPVEGGVPARTEPIDRSVADIAVCKGRVPLQLDVRAAAALFPSLASAVPVEQLASLVAASRVVGVECPGLHSLLAEIDLLDQPVPFAPEVAYRVDRVDSRFGLVRLQIETPGFTGHVEAFLRPKPTAQATVVAVRQAVRPGEFAGEAALVVGGSRGLGELTAKILAAGGAEVTLTYYRGEQDGARVVSEIRENGGTARSIRFDVLDEAQQSPDWLRPDALYYFASPFIFSGTKGGFSAELLMQFCRYYVTGFWRVVEAFAARGLTRVLYPSSVAIDDVPTDMGEYVVAKAAGEALAVVLEKRFRGLHVFRPRLPRMATDQTATQLPVRAADPLPVMVDVLRACHGGVR